ncbi:MAG TPA: FAD-dependent monooxygenase [Pyrinomonadaceae bacterium]|nr:FAD-dependent monooxygenase [Pyrinomonadaceae bacterium]
MSKAFDYDVIIAGGGPAGASAATHLAMRGARVLLAEQKKFPREKLCGEFISPECAVHFERLGVIDRMLAAGPARLQETVFYARNGKSVCVPSAWFGANGSALGLSRAEMDERLLRRAGEAGVTVLEDAQVADLLFEQAEICGVSLKSAGNQISYRAPVTIDATGRARSLARRVGPHRAGSKSNRAPLVAFKAHLEDARVAPGACEIYFYRGGYGGLSSIEDGRSNLCFIASARDVRACAADAERVMREIVCQNARAAHTLANARARSAWLAVTLESFGRHQIAPAKALLTIGDAASFIDPFTGSGMLMALESGELAAQVIADHLDAIRDGCGFEELSEQYRVAYERKFDSRLRICSLMRRAAFAPGLAEMAIRFFRTSVRLRQFVTRATRGSSRENLRSAAS